jgi:VWFA-related protein
MSAKAWAIGLILGFLGGDALIAQSPVSIRPRGTAERLEIAPRPNIRVDTTLVLIPVSVTDPFNRPVTGLEKDHFRIFEEKVEQTVEHLASEDSPLAVGLLFDLSGSMKNKLQKARKAAAEFLKTCGEEDGFFLVEFNDRPRLAAGLTERSAEIQNRLTFSQAGGRTALLDAIYLGMHELRKSEKPRKALLVISDGADNSSRYTVREVRDLVRESDALIYAIGIFEPISSRGRTAEELSGPTLLSGLAEQTGGRHFPVENLNELPDIAVRIGIELRNRYVLGYTPKNQPRDGKFRRVQVKLVQPRGLPALRVYWKSGYYAPPE